MPIYPLSRSPFKKEPGGFLGAHQQLWIPKLLRQSLVPVTSGYPEPWEDPKDGSTWLHISQVDPMVSWYGILIKPLEHHCEPPTNKAAAHTSGALQKKLGAHRKSLGTAEVVLIPHPNKQLGCRAQLSIPQKPCNKP